MESYLMISHLNDFIFCPRSIYFHQLYGRMSTRVYHSSDQTRGLSAHKTIDSQSYSTATSMLQGIEVFSEKYNLCGKIDLYDKCKKLLVERKKKIKVVYDGFIFQLYAQYFCLIEMGYDVAALKLYSMDDNKSYPIALPCKDQTKYQEFCQLIQNINQYRLNEQFTPNENKCKHCIYQHLCDVSLC